MNFLFCEDNRDDTELIIRGLRNFGFIFKSVIVEARSDFKDKLVNCDVLFVDCNLPSFGCYEAIQIWEKAGKKQPFIIVSGTINTTEGILLEDFGATDFVLKRNLESLGNITERAFKKFGKEWKK